MKAVFKIIGIVLSVGLVLYLYRDVFIGKKMVCNDITISRDYYDYISKNKILDSLCYYSTEVKRENFNYLYKISFLGINSKRNLDIQNIIVKLIIDSNEENFKKYFNNSANRQFRFLVYISLKKSDEIKAKNILKKIEPTNDGNDFFLR